MDILWYNVQKTNTVPAQDRGMHSWLQKLLTLVRVCVCVCATTTHSIFLYFIGPSLIALPLLFFPVDEKIVFGRKITAAAGSRQHACMGWDVMCSLFMFYFVLGGGIDLSRWLHTQVGWSKERHRCAGKANCIGRNLGIDSQGFIQYFLLPNGDN